MARDYSAHVLLLKRLVERPCGQVHIDENVREKSITLFMRADSETGQIRRNRCDPTGKNTDSLVLCTEHI